MSQAPARQVALLVCAGTGCVAGGAFKIREALELEIDKRNLRSEVSVEITGCNGFCGQGPLMVVQPDGIFYGFITPEDVPQLVDEHLIKGKPVERLMYVHPVRKEPIPLLSEIPFFKRQMPIVLRNRGIINPEKIETYTARDGYAALQKALGLMTPDEIIEEIVRSGLRGRGGAGFPTGLKWRACRVQRKTPKYLIGNCDEGDPGAYMDRSVFESDPHSVIEGITIAAHAVGASRGYFYIRTEYPLAITRARIAIGQAMEHGFLGKNILGSGFDFHIEIREGSGAFVCGEETSLIHSIEGNSPEPRQRPPFPAEVGLWGCPTVINNVETLATVPAIILRGADWYSGIGTETSKGTKIFSLVGKINNSGLIEVPMGITLREIVYDIGGGIPGNRKLKAVQTGGPSGGCIPHHLIDLPVDYESLKQAGSIMGSGGMIVMDENTCMVDIAKYFIQFTNDESCGKCTTCRDGSDALLEVLTRITDGEGKEGDLELLEELSLAIKDGSMCGLGTSLPNPVLSTLRYFRDEYEEHIRRKRCPAVVCSGLISSPCQYQCPLKTDVPAYLTLIAKGRFEEALDVIRLTNPLPLVCGRICMAHCEVNCRARETGDAIAIKNLKRFLSDREAAAGQVPGVPSPPLTKHDEKIAIVGSGPAGLTAGYSLVRKGYDVSIFEKLPVAGGMLAVGIPEFRLPKKLLEMEIETIRRAGVVIHTGSPVENVETLLNSGYKAVLIAVGAHKNRRLGIPGEDAPWVFDPIAFLRRISLREEVPFLGHRVGIVGGGNAAIDVARTALRLGSNEVIILYRRTRAEMPAITEETEAALEEGLRIEFLVAPTKVVSGNGQLRGVELVRMRLGDPDITGRRRPIPIEGSEFFVELDALIPAISQDPDLSLLPAGCGIGVSKANTITVDEETFATSRKGVFACGDAVTGPSDVTTAMASARVAAEAISRYLRNEGLTRVYERVIPSVTVEPLRLDEEMARLSRPVMPMLPPERRRHSFDEVERGYSTEMAREEAARCLRCDWAAQEARRQRDAKETDAGSTESAGLQAAGSPR